MTWFGMHAARSTDNNGNTVWGREERKEEEQGDEVRWREERDPGGLEGEGERSFKQLKVMSI